MHPHQPFFVGGTGRSGSTVVGYLMGSHPDIWATTPREIRFLTDPGGLLDLVLGYGGRVHPSIDRTLHGASRMKSWAVQTRMTKLKHVPVSPAAFMRSMYGPWWERRSPEGEPRGLHRGLDEQAFQHALQRFDASLRTDRLGAARDLVHELLDAPAAAVGARAWVDTTPQNGENAHRIATLLPQAKVVFMIRDGRDTCASVLQKQWGPDSPQLALEWWRRAALRGHRAVTQAGQGHALTVRFDELVHTRRQETLQELFDFLGYEVTPEVQAFFDERMSGRKANTDRWARDIPADALPAFERRYAEIHEELTAAGLRLPPL